MLLIQGQYRFGTKRASCRNDYCSHCRQQTFVEGFRSFRFLHIYWIPILPLGFATDWFCTRCRKDPAGKRPISPALAVAGLIAGLTGLTIAFLIPGDDFDASTRGAMFAVFGGLSLGMLYLISRGGSAEYLASRRNVTPLSRHVCPYCGNETLQRLVARCEQCDVSIR